MIVNGITVTAALAGVTLAVVLSTWLVRGSSAPQARREAMRKGTHPAGKRHVTEGLAVPPPPERDPAAARRLALTWQRLADAALETAYVYERMGAQRAAYEAWQRAESHRAEAARYLAMAQAARETGSTIDVRA